MNYTVWVKDEYDETWRPKECGDLGAVKRIVLQAAKDKLEARITVEVPFEVQIKVGDPGAEVKRKTKKETTPAEATTETEEQDETDKDQSEQN